MQDMLLPKAQFTSIGGFAPAATGAHGGNDMHAAYDGADGQGPAAAAGDLADYGPRGEAIRCRGWHNNAAQGEQWQQAHVALEDSAQDHRRHIFKLQQEQEVKGRAGQALPQVGCDWQ